MAVSAQYLETNSLCVCPQKKKKKKEKKEREIKLNRTALLPHLYFFESVIFMKQVILGQILRLGCKSSLF